MTQMVTSNIGGTVHTSFRIHNNGPIIYQGSSQPTVGSYNDGDLWVLHTNGGSLAVRLAQAKVWRTAAERDEGRGNGPAQGATLANSGVSRDGRPPGIRPRRRHEMAVYQATGREMAVCQVAAREMAVCLANSCLAKGCHPRRTWPKSGGRRP